MSSRRQSYTGIAVRRNIAVGSDSGGTARYPGEFPLRRSIRIYRGVLRFRRQACIFTAVMKLMRAIIQAIIVAAVAAVAALVFNAAQPNGIDPFRRPVAVPVVDGTSVAPGGDSGAPQEGIRYISLEQMREILEAGDPVLDARTAGEYAEGHIPGAVLCDYYEMGTYFDRVLPRLTPETRIGVYCSGPLCEDSEMLARELYAIGYTNLHVFRGGIEEWTEAGLPLETSNGEGRR